MILNNYEKGSISIKVFPASYGESFLIRLNGESVTNILVDCGFTISANLIEHELWKLKENGECLDLLVLTHIDNDHIYGAKQILQYIIDKNIEVKDIWFNDYLKIIEKYKGIEKFSLELEGKIKQLCRLHSHDDTGTRNKNPVGYVEASCVTNLLYNDKLITNWNRATDGKCICLYKNSIFRVPINSEVNIVILGPSLENLDELFNQWDKYLDKIAGGRKIVKNKKAAEAFEKYFLVLYQNYINTYKMQCSTRNDIQKFIDYSEYDSGLVNRSSISIIIEFNEKKLLFLGDSSPLDMEDRLQEYINHNSNEFSVVKVAHHGSKNNMSKKMIEIINCDRYIISTNGLRFNHPDIETVSKLLFINNSVSKKLYCNYKPTILINRLKAMGIETLDKLEIENEKPNQKKIQEIII